MIGGVPGALLGALRCLLCPVGRSRALLGALGRVLVDFGLDFWSSWGDLVGFGRSFFDGFRYRHRKMRFYEK